jgi:hypothetical protein
MFNKHTEIYTDSGSIRLLVVDITRDSIAYFDLNKLVGQNTKTNKKDSNGTSKALRVQKKPNNVKLIDFLEEINGYQYKVRAYEYQNGLYVPERLSYLDKQRVTRKRDDQADENYELIQPIVENPDKRYEYLYTDRGQSHIVQRSIEKGVKASLISRLLSQYFFRGMNLKAMYPNYRRCGSNYQPPSALTEIAIKRGRSSRLTNFRNRLEIDEKAIELHLKNLGKKKFKRFSYQKLYEIFDYMHQSLEVGEEGAKVKIPKKQSDCISYDQYYYYVKKLENEGKLHWQQKADDKYAYEYEQRLSRARDGVPGPAFRFEIDATIEDVYLSFEYFPELRLSSGRPTTYRMMCVYSGMTVGIHVGISGPNWEGVMQCLYNGFTDKVEFCARYGVQIDSDTWPCFHVCTELTIDNGVEYPKKQMIQLLEDNFGIQCINYTAIYSGEQKGTVEGGFEHDKKDIIKFMPGYVERIPERNSKHASNLAVYTYDQFVRLLIVQTLIRNNEIFNPRLHDKAMSEHGVKATSREVWLFGMKHYMNNGRGKKYPKEQILQALLPSGTASTTAKGIRFKGVYYLCDFARIQGWLTDSKSRPVKTLDVRYFDGSTNKIWYRYEGVLRIANINEAQSECYKDKTWFDALHRMEFYREEEVEQEMRLREARFAQKQIQEATLAEAKERLAGTRVPKRKSANKNISVIADMQKRLNQQKTSELYKTLLGNEINASKKAIVVNPKYSSTDQNFLNMYGEN